MSPAIDWISQEEYWCSVRLCKDIVDAPIGRFPGVAERHSAAAVRMPCGKEEQQGEWCEETRSGQLGPRECGVIAACG